MPKVFLALAIFFFASVIAIAFYNQGVVPIKFMSLELHLPIYFLLAKGYALGLLTSYCVYMMRRKETKVEQKKLEWKTEDAKLQTEIQSDRVLQLEMQVETLTTALDKALKRGKS